MILHNRYFLDDPETGLYEVDKESYEAHHKAKQEFFDKFIKPNIDASKTIRGTISITSAPIEDGDNFDFKKLWK